MGHRSYLVNGRFVSQILCGNASYKYSYVSTTLIGHVIIIFSEFS